jgi:hypothetical protein
MGAGDAPRLDAERREPVRQSARGAVRRGPHRRPTPGRMIPPAECRRRGRGCSARPHQGVPPGAPPRSRRRPAGSPSDPS